MGQRVSVDSSSSGAPFCRYCGDSIPPFSEAVFCPNCGTRIAGSSTTTGATAPPPPPLSGVTIGPHSMAQETFVFTNPPPGVRDQLMATTQHSYPPLPQVAVPVMDKSRVSRSSTEDDMVVVVGGGGGSAVRSYHHHTTPPAAFTFRGGDVSPFSRGVSDDRYGHHQRRSDDGSMDCRKLYEEEEEKVSSSEETSL